MRLKRDAMEMLKIKWTERVSDQEVPNGIMKNRELDRFVLYKPGGKK